MDGCVYMWAGPERVNYEAALFHNCVIVADQENGADPRDFPLPARWKVDGYVR